jgi:hypothetical protein
MTRALFCLSVILVFAPRAARAADASPVIALLPLAADNKLDLYGQPVAAEVARALEQDGFAIVLVTSTSPVPSRARLVIDGRIVRGDDGAIVLEARVRDPATSETLGQVRSGAAALTRIDEAAVGLAERLGPVLRDGLAALDRADRDRLAARTDRAAPAAAHGAAGRRAGADRRPVALITFSPPAARGADDPVAEPRLRHGAGRMASLLGYRADPSATDAALFVHIDLLGVDYRDRGVITARARARVRVSDTSGVVFERVVRTDTLVGGRGDRKDAVLAAAVEQIVDIAVPRVRDRLEAAR